LQLLLVKILLKKVFSSVVLLGNFLYTGDATRLLHELFFLCVLAIIRPISHIVSHLGDKYSMFWELQWTIGWKSLFYTWPVFKAPLERGLVRSKLERWAWWRCQVIEEYYDDTLSRLDRVWLIHASAASTRIGTHRPQIWPNRPGRRGAGVWNYSFTVWILDEW